MSTPNLYEFGKLLEPDAPLLCARAEEILSAIRDNKDFELQSIRRFQGEKVQLDIFCGICTSEGVPNRNPVGIEHREPLAIAVSTEADELPAVYPLRQDFPATGHQNNAPPGLPMSLCLYAQRPKAVLRTWTAAAYLRRIQWWLEETAKGQLHQTDQPLEQVFFESQHELILPVGYLSETRPTSALGIESVLQRECAALGPCLTIFLKPADGAGSNTQGVHLVDLLLQPVTAANIEREPTTLGALEDQVTARGVSVLEPLIHRVEAYVGTGRAPEPNRAVATILLLRIPTKRAPDGAVEQTQVRAFSLDNDLLEIGQKIGALFRIQGDSRFYVDRVKSGTSVDTAWRDVLLFPLTVLERPTREAARRMSGTSEPGPRGVVAGAGALGGTLIDLWRRCGWGSWDMIDPDHLRPHNLIRHVCGEVGVPKAEALVHRDQYYWRDPMDQIRALVSDASNLDDAAVSQSLLQAELLVDTSTVLDVPRRWAVTDTLKRVVSCFLTPSGSDAVLLAEDTARTARVDALEAQYLRAVLNETWGEEHLSSKTDKFRSGTSCRDFSFVMPYSAVVLHAATMAQQIQTLPGSPLARVWQRDQETGAISARTVPIEPILIAEAAPFTIIWDEGILRKVRRLRAKALPQETGGVLIGYHDLSARRIYVVDALAAPADSLGTVDGFERGVKGLERSFEEIRRRTSGQVGYLGEWHSHPNGVPARPSDNDLWQLLYLGGLLQRENLPALQMIVGKKDHAWLLIQ